MTHCEEERYITGIQDHTLIGYKYFHFDGKVQLTLKVRGTGEGQLIISNGEKVLGEMVVPQGEEWKETTIVIEVYGVAPLLLTYQGSGTMDFISFGFSKGK